MEKINGFQISGMTLSGFKSYAEPTDLVFGNPTVITGGNGTGKSSIADAIAFAITGLPFFGERGIDRLHSEGNPEVFVSLHLVDHAGNPHELTRTRQKNRMAITYDGYEIRQLDLTELFGERDVFLTIFNPLYFIEELGDEGKHLLERYLPAISHEDVLSALSEQVRLALLCDLADINDGLLEVDVNNDVGTLVLALDCFQHTDDRITQAVLYLDFCFCDTKGFRYFQRIVVASNCKSLSASTT